MPKKLLASAIRREVKKRSGWKVNAGQLQKKFRFSDFVGSMAFVNHVAIEAEKLDHHPDITIRYNEVTLTLSTHSAGGLTALDFTLAKRIDG